MRHGAWRSHNLFLPQKSNAHFCYYYDYLFTFRAFFFCRSLVFFFFSPFHTMFSKPHLLSSTAHTPLSFHLTEKWKLSCAMQPAISFLRFFWLVVGWHQFAIVFFYIISRLTLQQKPICFIICYALFNGRYRCWQFSFHLQCNFDRSRRSRRFVHDWLLVFKWRDVCFLLYLVCTLLTHDQVANLKK